MGGRATLEEIWAEIHDFTEGQNNRSKLRSNRRSTSLTLLITLFVAIIISMDGWLWLLGCGVLGLIYKILYDVTGPFLGGGNGDSAVCSPP
jgi:hypothetical protein